MMISVVMITYNHEKYIAQAIDSVIMQNTDFDYEIVIGEDCSTDNTREIVLNYKSKHLGTIKLILQENNVGMMQNFIDTIKLCSGKYIAILEGDDYWTDPYKLKKQVDLMSKNPNYSLCFTARNVIDETGSFLSTDRYPQNQYTTEDFLEGFIPPTQTILFKNYSELQNFLEYHKTFPSGDRLLSYFCSLHGEILYLPEITAVYRDSGLGIWSSTTQNERTFVIYRSLKNFHKIIGLTEDNKILIDKAVQGAYYLLRKNKKNPILLLNEIKSWYKEFLIDYKLSKIFYSFISLSKDYFEKRFHRLISKNKI